MRLPRVVIGLVLSWSGLWASQLWAAPHLAQTAPASAAKANPTELSEALKTQLKKTQRQISRLRGLYLRRKIPLSVVKRSEMMTLFESKIAQRYPDPKTAVESAVLKLLGLIPSDLDYRATIRVLYAEDLAGFYDPASRQLYLVAGLSPAQQELVLRHELCHALQDQHFNLRRLFTPTTLTRDQELARAALVEGDCSGVMTELALLPQGLDLGDLTEDHEAQLRRSLAQHKKGAYISAPRFMQQTLLFPQAQGFSLARQLRARHPWSLISQLFRRPPESTEQILHLGKYFRREKPVRVRAHVLPSLTGYTLIKQDVLGEFVLSLLLEQGLDQEAAQRAAEGWGGELLVAYQKEDRQDTMLLIHYSSWDSEADALEFANGLRHGWLKRTLRPVALPQPRPNSWVYRDERDRWWSLRLEQERVLWLAAVPSTLQVTLEQEVLKRWRVSGK